MLATALILQTRGGSPSSKQGKTAVLSEPVGLVGAPQILTDHLTQSRPGEKIMPTTLVLGPLGFSNLPTALKSLVAFLCTCFHFSQRAD